MHQRRRPERSVAYQVVKQNLETWLARRRAGGLVAGADWVVDTVRANGERALRKYLECGISAHGFARARSEQWARFSGFGQLVVEAAGAGVETAIYVLSISNLHSRKLDSVEFPLQFFTRLARRHPRAGSRAG